MQGIPIVSPIVQSLPTIHQSLSASGVPARSPHLTSPLLRIASPPQTSPGKCGEEYRTGLTTNRAAHSRRPVRLDNHAYDRAGGKLLLHGDWGNQLSFLICKCRDRRYEGTSTVASGLPHCRHFQQPILMYLCTSFTEGAWTILPDPRFPPHE